MAKDSRTLRKGAVVQHIAKAHNLKGQLPEESMESLATTIRFVTLNCRTLASELQQAALSRLLRYLRVAEDNSKEAFYDELNALMSKMPSQQVVIVGIDANAKMGIEQSDVLEKWYYPAERTLDNGDSLIHLCEQTGFIIASTFKRNHRRHQLTWQGPTLLTPEEQRKRKMRTLKLQLDYVLARNIPRSSQLQDTVPQKKPRSFLFMFDYGPGRSLTLLIWRDNLQTLLDRQAPSAPELKDVHRPTYTVNKQPPTESELPVCIQKMNNGKSGGDDGSSAEMLKYLSPSGIREMAKIIRPMWINEWIPDSWRHVIIIPFHKKLSITDPRNYRGISLLCVMYKVLERIILDRLIKHREDTTRDEQAGFCPDRSTITGIRVNGQPTELVDEFCYLSYMLKNVRERCSAKRPLLHFSP
ncbi:hypothetical protein RB195_021901 [Necator americanus]|uniref:Reverse transcriptase domain-containing protein n=1 Tax=Necator americanus TaxID=51031 RepID=A0ABR1ED58_NECAM